MSRGFYLLSKWAEADRICRFSLRWLFFFPDTLTADLCVIMLIRELIRHHH